MINVAIHIKNLLIDLCRWVHPDGISALSRFIHQGISMVRSVFAAHDEFRDGT